MRTYTFGALAVAAMLLLPARANATTFVLDDLLGDDAFFDVARESILDSVSVTTCETCATDFAVTESGDDSRPYGGRTHDSLIANDLVLTGLPAGFDPSTLAILKWRFGVAHRGGASSQTVPEPATLLLFGPAAAAALLLRRRKARRKAA